MELKLLYRGFCSSEPSIPIFSKDWWLDAVCGHDYWGVCVIENGGNVVATMPYYYKKNIFKIQLLSMPLLTQTLGPWISPTSAKYAKKLAREKDLMNELISQLPKFDYFSQNFHYNITNWLPFYWQGFKQTTRYTYAIENLTDLDVIWSNFQSKIRTDIRKAEKQVSVLTDLPLETFYQTNVKTFERQNIKIPYTFEFIKNIDKTCAGHSARKMFFAVDRQNQIHAVVYIVWDDNSAYYLMGGADPNLRNSGASSLLMWEAIKFASTVTKKFDFEGSMIEPVERFFRAFGGIQKPYFNISKFNLSVFQKTSAYGSYVAARAFKKIRGFI